MAAVDRRRANAPSGGTHPPAYAPPASSAPLPSLSIPERSTNEIRKIYLRTNLVPSASGSAYLELDPPAQSTSGASHVRPPSALKLTATVHGPRPLPRNHAYTPSLLLTASVKFAPFAGRVRRGYVRDAAERDLAAHLEAALRAVVLADRWPKSGVEVVVTVLEGEEQLLAGGAVPTYGEGNLSLMAALAGCVTVGSAALAAAGIECADVAGGGVAALVRTPLPQGLKVDGNEEGAAVVVLDPPFAALEPNSVLAACAVGYLPSRDEIGECWIVGDVPLGAGNEQAGLTALVDGAAKAAGMAAAAVREAVKEGLGIEAG